MIEIAKHLLIVFLALSSGIVVGTSYVALLVIFDLIPRLAQICKAYSLSHWYEMALIWGALYFTAADFFDLRISLPSKAISIISGLMCGIFIGLLAAALTEVMNVLPILARRLRLHTAMIALMMAMVFGKTIGSLFDWLWFQW